MVYFNQYYGIFIGDWVWHKIGYKHKEDNSKARNFLPFSFGEGLHSNHHAYPYKINKACQWFEIDFTYYILILCSWARIIKFNPQLKELA
jgi:fatty-acid desaturase